LELSSKPLTNPYKEKDGGKKGDRIKKGWGWMLAGWRDTLVAAKLNRAGVKIVGVPKTIDNDLAMTDYTSVLIPQLIRVEQ
jgi:6-phosphofructokinase 1